MKPHPPPYLTLEELERHHGCPEDDQEPFSDGTADYDEVTEYARDDLIIDDLIIDDTADYTEETELWFSSTTGLSFPPSSDKKSLNIFTVATLEDASSGRSCHSQYSKH